MIDDLRLTIDALKHASQPGITRHQRSLFKIINRHEIQR